MNAVLKCIDCGKSYDEQCYRCDCNGLLEVVQNLSEIKIRKEDFDRRMAAGGIYKSGVWRYKELIHPLIDEKDVISKPEGNTNLYKHKKVSDYCGIDNLKLKHEGENPTGSFKDRGMTVGISEAKRQRAAMVACASTGNTSASMAAYAAMADIDAVVFIPEGKIAYGKLSQAIAYGAKVLQLKGNFDDTMRLVQEVSKEMGMYLLNSINPWRIEGQKSIIFEMLQQLNWETPDWVVVPAGNLGNTSAFGKAFFELYELGIIKEIPRIAAIQAEGANPFYRLWKEKSKVLMPVEKPNTIATAIKIGNPVSWKKALKAVEKTNGVVEQVSDEEIMEAKAVIDRSGIGCEPASATAVAGAKKLKESGVIDGLEEVVCILTGNILKDPDTTINYHKSGKKFSNAPIVVDADIEIIKRAIKG